MGIVIKYSRGLQIIIFKMDFSQQRDERDENEIKRLAELHFEQRKEDDAKLEELANLIETTKQKRKITRKERAEEANRRNKIIEADEKRRKEKQKLAERNAQNERKEIKSTKQNEDKPKQREKKRLRRRVVALNEASSAILV